MILCWKKGNLHGTWYTCTVHVCVCVCVCVCVRERERETMLYFGLPSMWRHHDRQERWSLRKWMDLICLSLRKANITEMLADRHWLPNRKWLPDILWVLSRVRQSEWCGGLALLESTEKDYNVPLTETNKKCQHRRRRESISWAPQKGSETNLVRASGNGYPKAAEANLYYWKHRVSQTKITVVQESEDLGSTLS
jgi:hypothetical protein